MDYSRASQQSKLGMSQQGQPAAFIYPTLKNAEIIQCMNELNVPFTEEDLHKPTAQRMQMVYEAFADLLMGYTRETFENSIVACESQVDNFEIYNDSMGMMMFYQQLVRLMAEVGVEDFSIRDLIKPDAQHVRRILSAVINFAKFREERMHVFDAHGQKAEEYATRHHALIGQLHDLSARTAALKLQREEEGPLIQKSKEGNHSLTSDLRELKKQQTTLTNEIDALKREKNELTEKLTNNQFIINNSRQESVKIKSRIVTSPEKLKTALGEMSASLANEKASVVDLERKGRNMQERIDAVTFIEGEITGCIRLMEECEVEIGRLEQERGAVVKGNDGKERAEIEVREVDVREQQLHRQLNNAEDKLTRVQRQATSKRETIQKKIAAIREEYGAMSNERAARTAETERKRAQIEQTERKITDLKAHTEAEVRGVVAEYAKLKAHVDRYMEEMSSAMTTVV